MAKVEPTKVCTKCKVEKPLSEFSKDKSTKSGHRPHCKGCVRQYRQEHEEEIKHWHKNHKKERNERERNRYRTNIQHKLKVLLRTRMGMAIKGDQKSGSAVQDLGCSIEELKKHLEFQFQPGMTWDNWALDGWHIDHIIPLASADLTDRKQFLEACHYTNLQPLWVEDNLKKRYS